MAPTKAGARVWLIGAAAWAACTGNISAPTQSPLGKTGPGGGPLGGPGNVPPAAAGLGRLDQAALAACSSQAVDPGPSVMRRLTRREYNNVVADLLGDTSAPANGFPNDERTLNFDDNAAALTVSPTLAEAYGTAAATLATTALANNAAQLAPCDTSKETPASCGTKFIKAFGQRAFRRPMSADEVTAYTAVFTQGLQTDFQNGVNLTIQAMLQSAPFLYRVEFGETPAASASYVKLTSWEMASRLSFLLWGSMPDDKLFAAAAADQLLDRSAVQAQVQRMLTSDKAHRMIENFHIQWLGLGDAVSVDKDATLFPNWAPDMLAQQLEETSRFVDQVVWNDPGGFNALLQAPYSMVNAPLARLYGVTGGNAPTGVAWTKVAFNPGQRAGLLTQGSVLAYFAKINSTSPVRRGKFVREQLFGEYVEPPPPNVPPAPDVDPTLTTRQRFAEHETNPQCSGCHLLMDPLGFGLEGFDAVGAFRTTESNQTVDASGEIKGTDVAGTFNGAADLAGKLASSNQVKRNYVSNWFRFAYSRTDAPADDCVLHALDARFVQGNFDVKALVTALTDTSVFYYRRAGSSL